MTKFTLTFRCAYCDAELNASLSDDGWIEYKDYHECWGETKHDLGWIEDGLNLSGTGEDIIIEVQE